MYRYIITTKLGKVYYSNELSDKIKSEFEMKNIQIVMVASINDKIMFMQCIDSNWKEDGTWEHMEDFECE